MPYEVLWHLKESGLSKILIYFFFGEREVVERPGNGKVEEKIFKIEQLSRLQIQSKLLVKISKPFDSSVFVLF